MRTDPWPMQLSIPAAAVVVAAAAASRKLVESTRPGKRISFSKLAFYAAESEELVGSWIGRKAASMCVYCIVRNGSSEGQQEPV